MKRDKSLLSLLLLTIIVGLFNTVPARANTPPPWTVSLDADSTSTTDATVQSTHNFTGSFIIGAIINASSTHPVGNVAGWQFGIVYDNTTVVPTKGPGTTNYGARFGSQTGTGNPNWAGWISSTNALGISNLVEVDPTHQEVLIGFALIAQPPVTIAPSLSPNLQGNLLANINFTLRQTPTSSLTFNITDVKFADNNGSPIPNIGPGSTVTENMSTTPPPGGTQNPPATNLFSGPIPYIIAIIAATAIAGLLIARRRKTSQNPRPARQLGLAFIHCTWSLAQLVHDPPRRLHNRSLT